MTNHPNRSDAKSPASNPTPDQIKDLRISFDLTAKQAASLIYCTERAWHMWESGDRRMHPGLWELFRIKTEK